MRISHGYPFPPPHYFLFSCLLYRWPMLACACTFRRGFLLRLGFLLAVIRGEEWLPSACKHVLLYHAFNTIASIREEPPVKMPKWAHLPLLLNAEGGKLSKRHSHGSVSSLRAALYEPQAVVNFVASLGFTFASDNQILSLPDLAAQFDLSRVHAGGAQVCVRVSFCVCARACACVRVCVRVFVVLCVMNIRIIINHSY